MGLYSNILQEIGQAMQEAEQGYDPGDYLSQAEADDLSAQGWVWDEATRRYFAPKGYTGGAEGFQRLLANTRAKYAPVDPMSQAEQIEVANQQQFTPIFDTPAITDPMAQQSAAVLGPAIALTDLQRAQGQEARGGGGIMSKLNPGIDLLGDIGNAVGDVLAANTIYSTSTVGGNRPGAPAVTQTRPIGDTITPIPAAERFQEGVERRLEEVPVAGPALGLASELLIPTTPLDLAMTPTGFGLAGDVADAGRLARGVATLGRTGVERAGDIAQAGARRAGGQAGLGANLPIGGDDLMGQVRRVVAEDDLTAQLEASIDMLKARKAAEAAGEIPPRPPTETLGQFRARVAATMEAALGRPLNEAEQAALKAQTKGKLVQTLNQVESAQGIGNAPNPRVDKLTEEMGEVPRAKMTPEAVSAIRRRRAGGTEIPLMQDPMAPTSGARQAATAPSAAPASPPVTAIGGGPPNRKLPLGTRGGGGFDRNLDGIGLTDEANAIVRAFRDDIRGRAASLPTGTGARTRRITSAATGELRDRYLNEVAVKEGLLQSELFRVESQPVLDMARVINTADMDANEIRTLVVDIQSQLQDIQAKAAMASKAFREEVVKQAYTGPERKAALNLLARHEAKIAAQTTRLYDDIANVLKEITFGVDMGVIGQQGIKGVRMGASGLVSSALGHAYDRMARAMGKADDLLGVYPNKAISPATDRMLHIGVGGSKAMGLERGAKLTAPVKKPLGRKALDAAKNPLGTVGSAVKGLTDFQYRQLEKMRTQIYEGLLYQAKAMGIDISNPQVREQIGAYARTAGSSARTATDPVRALVERRTMLSAQLTRSQFEELSQPLNLLTKRNPTAAVLTANQIASTLATFGTAYAIADQFGADISWDDFKNGPMNPMSKNFGRLVLKATDGTGANIVWDFLPQYSLEKALLKSLRTTQSLAKGDIDAKKALTDIGDSMFKFGFGRLNVPIHSVLTGLGGTGYGENGQFYYHSMPWIDRAKGVTPAPLSVKNIALQPRVGDAVLEGKLPKGLSSLETAANVTGTMAYGESSYNMLFRKAEDEFGESLFSLPPKEQSRLIVKAIAEGTEVPDEVRIGPYIYASNGALTYVKQNLEKNAGVQKNQREFLDELGMTSFNIQDYETMGVARKAFVEQALAAGAPNRKAAEKAWDKYTSDAVLGIESLTRKMREEVIRADPDVVDAYMREYEAGRQQYAPPNWAEELADEVRGR